MAKVPILVDHFAGTNGTELSTHTPDLAPGPWIWGSTPPTYKAYIQSNQLTRTQSPIGPQQTVGYSMNVTYPVDHQYFSFKLATVSGLNVISIFPRYTTTPSAYYVVLNLRPLTNQFDVQEALTGNPVNVVASATGINYNVGDQFEIQVNSADMSVVVYQNSILKASGTLTYTPLPSTKFSFSWYDLGFPSSPNSIDDFELGYITGTDNWTNTLGLSASSPIQTQPSIKLSDGSILIGKSLGTLGVYTPFIYRSTDNGDNWTAVLQQSNGLAATPPTSTNYIFSVEGFLEVGGGVVIANGATQGTVAGSGAIKTTECYSVWRSADYGATWTPVVGIRGLSDAYGSIIANDNSIVVTGQNDREAIYGTSAYASSLRSIDGGLTFTPTLTGALNDWTQSTSTGVAQYIWKTNTGRLLTSKSNAAFDNIILKSDNNGASWSTAQNLGATDTYNIIATSTPMFLSELNNLRQSIDNGDTWTVYASQPTFTGDLFYSGGTLFVVSGRIERSTGGAFTTVYNNSGETIYGVFKFGTDWYAHGGHFGANNILILLSTDDGLTWSTDQTDAVITQYNYVRNIIALSSTRLLATGGGSGGAGTFSNKLAWIKGVTPSFTGGSDILRNAILSNLLLRNRIVK